MTRGRYGSTLHKFNRAKRMDRSVRELEARISSISLSPPVADDEAAAEGADAAEAEQRQHSVPYLASQDSEDVENLSSDDDAPVPLP
jgi:hypothetical protein